MKLIEGYDLIRPVVLEKEVVLFLSSNTLSPTVTKPTCALTWKVSSQRYIYPPKSKPLIVGTLYRPPDKIDFVNYIDQIFSQFNKLET